MKNRNPIARFHLESALTIAMLLVLAACGSPTGPTPPALPGTPQGLNITTDGDGNSTLSWSSVSEADSYKVYHSSDGIAAYSEVSTTTGISYLLPFYGWYEVSAVNEAGEGAKSAGVERVEPATPNGPVATPTFTVPAGTFDEAQSVEIVCATGGSTIYYTTDGSTPIVGTSSIYATAIAVDPGDTTTITAVAAAADYSNSDAAVGTYHVRTWEVVGTAGFSGGEVSYLSMAINSYGTPYVAYRDEISQKAIVKYYTGTAWMTLGGAEVSSGPAFYISMAIDSANSVYVAYYDNDADRAGKATVRKYSFGGSLWTTIGGEGFTAGPALYISIAIDNAGTPYLAFLDGSDPLTRANVLYYNAGSWQSLAATRPSPGLISGASLVIAHDGRPYLAYIDGESGDKASASVFSGGDWSGIGGTSISSGSVGSISLALDHDGTPFVAYKDNGATASGKASLRTFNGSAWEFVGSEGFTPSTADFTAVRVDPGDSDSSTDDIVYMVFKDNQASATGKPSLMRFISSEWTYVGTPGIGVGLVLNGLDLAITGGSPYVAFGDGSCSGKVTVMVYR